MMVASQRFGNILLPHQHKRDAISQRPAMVRPFRIEFEPFVKKRLGGRDNRGVGVGSERLYQAEKNVPEIGRGQGIAYFSEHPRRRNDSVG